MERHGRNYKDTTLRTDVIEHAKNERLKLANVIVGNHGMPANIS